MITISPSLLACNFLELEKEVLRLNDIQDIWLHLDIMDGHFVPNLTFGHEIIRSIAKISERPLDAHFMVTNPEFYIESLKDVKLHNFTFHLEATHEPLKLIKMAKEHFPSVGLSLKPATPVEVVDEEVWKNIDLVLIMSVEPGFGGQKFMTNSLEKVRQLVKYREEKKLNFTIQIDGGINLETAPQAIQAGSDNLVAGSAVFKGGPDQYNKRINDLRVKE